MADDLDPNDLKHESRTYAAHKAELLKRAEGKFVLIKGDRILGIFDTQREGIRHGFETLGHVSFLTKQILPVDPVYMVYATAVGA